MKKIPDRVTMDKSALDMDHVVRRFTPESHTHAHTHKVYRHFHVFTCQLSVMLLKRQEKVYNILHEELCWISCYLHANITQLIVQKQHFTVHKLFFLE